MAIFQPKKSQFTKILITKMLLLQLSTFLSITKSSVSSPITKNHFTYSQFVIPHPDKVYKGGEDAYYSSSKVLAVADGVGGWARHGVDPALYSKKLCSEIPKLIENNWAKYRTNPIRLITDTHSLNEEKGSSTLVIVILPEDGSLLHTSYMGDSGYII